MPTYDYVCSACGHELEIFQSITEPAKKKCPKCGKSKLERQIGAGAGFLFKGSGFYLTDYRSKSYTDGAKADSSSSDATKTDAGAKDVAKAENSKSETSTESSSTKSEAKSESKSESKSASKSAPKPASKNKKTGT